ncbi:esterase/lipase family protein [Citricoccus sp. GCM10030269]|uniref:esterase/lipase family protein n=1 Tax=Citricoccus sp. GCM10030269 TaxID=3273388 RepID=UPI003622F1B8
MILSRLTTVRTNLTAWVRDYAYAVRWQADGAVNQADPQAYRRRDSAKPAIVLLPGIYESWTFMLPVANVLRDHGYDVHAVTELGYNGGTLEEMALVVDRYLRREQIERCVLVGHSKGGLIGRLLLAQHHQSAVIHGLVAVNTPFDGSPLARLLPLPALRVFLPHSPELAELAELSTSRDVDRNIVSIYGRFDPHIPGGSRLDGAHNVQLGTRGHFRPLSDRQVHRAILEGIELLTSARGDAA